MEETHQILKPFPYSCKSSLIEKTATEVPLKKKFKWDLSIPFRSLLAENKNIPKIVEYKSVYDYCDRLQISKPINTLSQFSENLTQPQYSGINVNSQSSKDCFAVQRKPYFPITVEELSVVTNIENWTNTNIRVCGKLIEECNGKYYLESVDETDGPFRVLLHLDDLNKFPMLNKTLQIFAQLIILDQPVLKVIFFRDFSKINLTYHRQVEEKMKKFIPPFVKQKESSCSVLNNTLDSFCFDGID